MSKNKSVIRSVSDGKDISHNHSMVRISKVWKPFIDQSPFHFVKYWLEIVDKTKQCESNLFDRRRAQRPYYHSTVRVL